MPENDIATVEQQEVQEQAAPVEAKGQSETAQTEVQTVTETPAESDPAKGQPITTAPVTEKEVAQPTLKELLAQSVKDEKALKLINHAISGGDMAEYFKAYNTDYNKLAPVELIKMQLTEQHKGLEPEELDELIQYELEKKYHQHEFADDADKKYGLIKMKADVKAFRESKIEEQKNLFVDTKDPLSETKAKEAEYETFVQGFKKTVADNPITQKLQSQKVLTIGTGKTAFNYNVAHPEKVVQYATDPGSAAALFSNPDGTPNVQKYLLSAAFFADMDDFTQKLIDHGKSIANISSIKENGNIQQPVSTSASTGGKLTIEQQIANGTAVRG